eukprot:scaffold1156_cov394-Prasinococcus_capsulatus_cf.AAC.16
MANLNRYLFVLGAGQLLSLFQKQATRARIGNYYGRGGLLGHHHLHKLLIIYLTITINIRLADHFVHLPSARGEGCIQSRIVSAASVGPLTECGAMLNPQPARA